MKPVQTGTAEANGDLATIHRLVPDLAPLPPELACAYAFPLAASPHLAAESAGETILIERIFDAIAAARRHPGIDLLLIEGVGGIMVPLQRNYLLRDLLRQADIPTLLVTRATLGTINHTLLSVNALRNREIRTAGLVVNRMPAAPGPVETDNLRYFQEALDVPLVAVVPDTHAAADAVAAMRHNPALQAWIKARCDTPGRQVPALAPAQGRRWRTPE
jgi:dethiobiotin synthetase